MVLPLSGGEKGGEDVWTGKVKRIERCLDWRTPGTWYIVADNRTLACRCFGQEG